MLRLCIVALVFAFCPTSALSENQVCFSSILRPQDQIWLISTRDGRCNLAQFDCTTDLRFYRYDAYSGVESSPVGWNLTDLATFLSEDNADVPTIIYVHGNRVSRQEARRRGFAFYRALVRQACDPRPIRFVVWSWPTDRVRGQLKDVRIKARRSDPTAFQLACLLDQIDPQVPIGMSGFSFGARVITGTLHLLGNGEMGRLVLHDRQSPERMPVRVVLMTSALHDHWLEPGQYHGRALSQVDRMLLLNNSCDPRMKWYHLVERCCHPYALGRWGVASLVALGDDQFKIDECDVCEQLGSSHDFMNYLDSPHYMSLAWTYLSFQVLPSGM